MIKKKIKIISRDKWIWMPHPAHFICSNDCKFFLATKVGKYIVSTVGEYFPDYQVREIFAQNRGVKLEGMGDARRSDYMKKIGFEEIGCNRKYETMVFECRKTNPKECKACPYRITVQKDVDFRGYNDPEEARKGHYDLCRKWSKQ